MWENSAAHDVWARPHEYLDFRSYVLSTLGDMGYLDHLIDDFNETLRELDFVGALVTYKTLLAGTSGASWILGQIGDRYATYTHYFHHTRCIRSLQGG